MKATLYNFSITSLIMTESESIAEKMLSTATKVQQPLSKST